jgi:hypothetical protein
MRRATTGADSVRATKVPPNSLTVRVKVLLKDVVSMQEHGIRRKRVAGAHRAGYDAGVMTLYYRTVEGEHSLFS